MGGGKAKVLFKQGEGGLSCKGRPESVSSLAPPEVGVDQERKGERE